MKSILYLVRAESDFERVVTFSIAAKGKYNQNFVFVGDSFPFYFQGIQNKFQKYLFAKNGFKMKDFCDFDLISMMLKIFAIKRNLSFETIIKSNSSLIIRLLFLYLLKFYLRFSKKRIVKKVLKRLKPQVLLTDASQTMDDYLPEMFRSIAYQMGIKTCIFSHGAAGGLHHAFTKSKYKPYKNYYVFICSREENYPFYDNRVILGDVCSSFPYVNYLNESEDNKISFLDGRKYKIAFVQAGVNNKFTSTNAWPEMEKIIIDLSENDDVAIIIKKHPRESQITDFRMLSTFKNVKIVGSECDRSRITKWADIIVCSDYCSTIFEPMILGKKVVAVEGWHIPKYKNVHSPIKHSSVNYITKASDFCYKELKYSNPDDQIINCICWGGNGKVDLADLFLNKMNEIISKKE